MKNILRSIVVASMLVASAVAAQADTVLEWNAIAIATPLGNPFNQARVVAITQLAVFEAVNAIEGGYQPYRGTVIAPAGASTDAAVIAAAHAVLRYYAPSTAFGMLDAARAASLAAIPDGPSKAGGIATGEAAAAVMIADRLNDGSAPALPYFPTSNDPYTWQLTGGCAAGGSLADWRQVKTFGIEHAADFRAGPPPALSSTEYAKAFNEVKAVGRKITELRPQDRTDVAKFYAASSPAYIFNMAARQIAVAQGRSLTENARAFALINMAISDSAVASFETKYTYTTWRPETAIHNADLDGNDRTDADATWEPLIVAPCFPAYTSNHGSLSNGGAEVLRRLYGEGEHSITITNPAFPALEYHYTAFHEICADISDARVFGGIHFRFDQDAGARLGREVGTAVYKGNLRKINQPE